MEKTLGIIKPDAVQRNLIGTILRQAESSGLKVKALKMIHLTKTQAQGFYFVHKERPFFDSLTTFMSEGPIVVVVFEASAAISCRSAGVAIVPSSRSRTTKNAWSACY